MLSTIFGDLQTWESEAMNKHFGLLIISIVVLATVVNSQNKRIAIKTAKYAGIYSFGHDVAKEAVGSFTVYPESDSTILFYLDICKGAPSYNLGHLFDRLVIRNDSALFFTKEEWNKNGCKLKLHFDGDTLTIKTGEAFNECPFGGNVTADHTYTRRNKSIPGYFINGEGDTIAFKNMTPDKYLHRFDDKK